jgi:hypothetical protein
MKKRRSKVKKKFEPILKWNHAKNPTAMFIFAHGYCFMDSEFMEYFTTNLQFNNVTVVRFEFPFMLAKRENGGHKRHDPVCKLISCFEAVIEEVNN